MESLCFKMINPPILDLIIGYLKYLVILMRQLEFENQTFLILHFKLIIIIL